MKFILKKQDITRDHRGLVGKSFNIGSNVKNNLSR